MPASIGVGKPVSLLPPFNAPDERPSFEPDADDSPDPTTAIKATEHSNNVM
jgi:hypothetical protein